LLKIEKQLIVGSMGCVAKRAKAMMLRQLYRYAWASAAGAGEAMAPWISIHGTNIVNKGLIVLFFGLFFAIFRSFFFVGQPWKRLYSAIFLVFFWYFSILFPLPSPLEIFLPTPLTKVQLPPSTRRVVASLDEAHDDNYLCLVASNKQQVNWEEVKAMA